MVTLDLPHHIGRIQSDQEGPLNPKGPVHFYHTSTAHTCNPWPSLILHLAVPDCQASLHFSLHSVCSTHSLLISFLCPFSCFPLLSPACGPFFLCVFI